MFRVLMSFSLLVLLAPNPDILADETSSYIRAGQLIVIQGEKIVAVSNFADVTIPEGSQVIF